VLCAETGVLVHTAAQGCTFLAGQLPHMQVAWGGKTPCVLPIRTPSTLPLSSPLVLCSSPAPCPLICHSILPQLSAQHQLTPSLSRSHPFPHPFPCCSTLQGLQGYLPHLGAPGVMGGAPGGPLRSYHGDYMPEPYGGGGGGGGEYGAPMGVGPPGYGYMGVSAAGAGWGGVGEMQTVVAVGCVKAGWVGGDGPAPGG
jgi:hypothetical protein